MKFVNLLNVERIKQSIKSIYCFLNTQQIGYVRITNLYYYSIA